MMKNKLLIYFVFLFIATNTIYAQDISIVSGKSTKKPFDSINGYYGGSTEQYRRRRAEPKICESCLGAGSRDTIPLFVMKVNPTLMFGQKEFGFMMEYHLRKNFSIEAGGGANVNYTYSWETSHFGKKLVAGEGFTIRTGMRFYSKSGIYFNPVFFYRRMIYHNRYYEWGVTNSKQFEPGIMSFGCGCDGDSGKDEVTGEVGDENKQVFAFEALVGKEFRWRRMTLDIYGGLGVRNKYKQKKIVSDDYYIKSNLFSLNNTSYYSPPKEENILGYLPTIHAGIQIGFLSKIK